MTMNAMQTIRIQIEKAPNGSIFTMNDFYGIAVSNNIKQCLSRLIKEGVLNRISRGIYEKMGGVLFPAEMLHLIF